jgi:hypothetical protein
MIVKIVADAVIDPKYNLPDMIPEGTTAVDFHLQVYWCAAEMGMEVLKGFAFKFMRASLVKNGLTAGELKNLIEYHKLFHPDICEREPTVPAYQNVLCAFATYVVAHEDDFSGNSMYGRLLLTTKGWLSYYLNAVQAEVKLTIEAIKKEREPKLNRQAYVQHSLLRR